MMMLKYVMIDHDLGKFPIVFSATIQHEAMKVHGPILSAGFVSFTSENGKVIVTPNGHSHKLGIGPAPDDAKILSVYF